MVDYIGKGGCFIVDFLSIYGFMFNYSMSFYLAVFRYVCVMHQGHLFNSGLSPMVRNLFTLSLFLLGPP